MIKLDLSISWSRLVYNVVVKDTEAISLHCLCNAGTPNRQTGFVLHCKGNAGCLFALVLVRGFWFSHQMGSASGRPLEATD